MLKDVGNAFVVLRVIFLDVFLNLGGIGHDHLQAVFDDKAEFIDARGVERIDQRNLQGAIVQRNGQALIHPRGVGGNGLDNLLRQFASVEGHDLSAELIGHELQDRIQLHDAEILQHLDDGFAGALELGLNLLVLEIVNQALVLDDGQQWI